jgi:hypothetical protein
MGNRLGGKGEEVGKGKRREQKMNERDGRG